MAKNTEEGIWETNGWHTYGSSRQEGGAYVKVPPLGGALAGTWMRACPSFNRPFRLGVWTGEIDNITNAYAGGEDFFAYSVPRYDSDPFVYAGQEPESLISRLTVSDMAWIAKSEAQSPWVYMGIWGPVSGWGAEIYAHEGLEGHSVTNLPWVYNSANQPPWT